MDICGILFCCFQIKKNLIFFYVLVVIYDFYVQDISHACIFYQF